MIGKFLSFVVALLLPISAFAVTGNLPITVNPPAGGVTAAALTMTNGPPNIPFASPGSCTIGSCTWVQAGGGSGHAVSDVYADLSPMSANYTGTFSLSGTGASNFTISTSSDGTRNVGHITTTAALAANTDYALTVTATGAGGSNTVSTTVHAVACTSSPSPGNNTIPTISGVVCLAAGTYNVSASIGIVSGGMLIGIPGSSIVDGTNETDSVFLDGLTSSIPNVLVNGVVFQHGKNNFRTLQAYNGWAVTNNIFQNILHGGAASGSGSAFIANNIIRTIDYNGIGSPGGGSGSMTIIGNELTGCNQGLYNINDDVGCMGKFAATFPGLLTIKNNYVHDANSAGLWFDFSSGGPILFTQNTVIRTPRVMVEISQFTPGFEGSFNFLSFNDTANNGNNCPNVCDTQGQDWWSSSSNHSYLHDNNVYVGPGGGSGQAFGLFTTWDSGRSQPDSTHVVFAFNTTTFSADTGMHGYGGNSTDPAINGIGTCNNSSTISASSPTCSNFNTFYVQTGNTGAAHWNWIATIPANINPYNPGALDWNTYRSTTGQDANSTLLTGSAGIGSGCLHVACSSAGVGSGGAPI